MKRFFPVLVVLSLVVFAASDVRGQSIDISEVGEGYASPTFKEMMQTITMMGGLDVANQDVADEYAKLIYCDLYTQKFKNDFEWNAVRRELVSRVLEKKELYRVQYEIQSAINLDRYNFESQLFPLTKDTQLENVGRITILDKSKFEPFCNIKNVLEAKYYSMDVRILLHQPILMTSLKMPMDEAQKMLKKMEEMKIESRKLYMRIRFRLSGTPVVNRAGGARTAYAEAPAHIKSIDLFLDRDMTYWVSSVPIVSNR